MKLCCGSLPSTRERYDHLLRLRGEADKQAGVRSLERELGKVCRTKAVEYSTSRQSAKEKVVTEYDPKITAIDVERILGIARFEQEVREETHRPGVVT
jgi:ATP-dependent Lon protease